MEVLPRSEYVAIGPRSGANILEVLLRSLVLIDSGSNRSALDLGQEVADACTEMDGGREDLKHRKIHQERVVDVTT